MGWRGEGLLPYTPLPLIKPNLESDPPSLHLPQQENICKNLKKESEEEILFEWQVGREDPQGTCRWKMWRNMALHEESQPPFIERLPYTRHCEKAPHVPCFSSSQGSIGCVYIILALEQ